MSTLVVVGAQWGDEGKGKIVDLLTPQANCVVRFQGGANAGHTLVIGKQKSVFHLLPSGVLHDHVQCVIGNGVVLDPIVCLREIKECNATGLNLSGRLWISPQTHVVLPQHKIIDELRETQSSVSEKIGTTKRGIGPAYEAKVARQGVRVCDIINPERLVSRLNTVVPTLNNYIEKILGGTPPTLADTIAEFKEYGAALAEYVTDTVALLHETIQMKKKVLFEGAQGTALDVDHGTYPYVTSSTTVASGACSGSGVGPTAIKHVLGVAKAYCTRVGEGPFPTELSGETGDLLRERGGEYGATTGRPRRCGWMDAVALRRAVSINGLTGLAISKVDVLQGFEKVCIATGYRLDGKPVNAWPQTFAELQKVEPVYEEMPGWSESCDGVKAFSDLPIGLQNYLCRLEKLTGVPVRLVSYGPDRAAHLLVKPVFDEE